MSAKGSSNTIQRLIPGVILAVAIVGSITLGGCKDKNAGTGSGGGTGTQATDATSPQTGTATTGSAGDAIVIGEYGSLTGPEASFGQSSDYAIKLAVDEVNQAGGVKGKQIKLETEDDSSDSSKAGTAVKRLIDEKKVVAVLGEVASGSSIAGGQVCQAAGIPMITPSSTKTTVTQVGNDIFRVCFIDPFQSAVVARFAHDVLKANTAAIYTNESQPYSKGFSTDFKTAFEKMGGKIVLEKSYGKDDKDFRGALTAFKQQNPDVILVPGYYSDAGSIVKQAREIGITKPLLGGDGWDSQSLFDTGGDAVNGCYFSDHMSIDNPSPTVQKFVKAFAAKYGKKPDALAALAYDAANLLFDAIKRAKAVTPADIRDAIAETKDFPGVTGSITMDADRNASKSAVIIAIKDKQFKFAAEIKDPNQPITK
jgi:branched-chain amino acid transport system substrate-binding protein